MIRRQARSETALNTRLERSVATYATVAGAAGVGLLALAAPAEAKVVYTKTHVVISYPGTYSLDLDNDGVANASISNRYSYFTTSNGLSRRAWYSLSVLAGGVEVENGRAKAIKPGTKIGPNRQFSPYRLKMASVSVGKTSNPTGYWVNVKKRFLGFKVSINGETHYGWARLKVEVQGLHITATLNGYAYESKPDKAIVAGDTGMADKSLGGLALGTAKGR